MKSAKEFICLVVYAGKSSENYVDKRCRICKNVKRKTSIAIPPDLDSVELAIKKAHLQTFTCSCCCKQIFHTLDQEEFGWQLTDGELKPLCFNGDPFLPSITGCRHTDGNHKDSESSDPDDGPSTVIKLNNNKKKKYQKKEKGI